MQLGMIGLGRMGANMGQRVLAAGHRCTVYDRDPKATGEVVRHGAEAANSLEDLVRRLQPPRAVWLMLPAAVDAVTDRLAALLEPGDTLVDGGNSHYRDDMERGQRLATQGIHYLDVGTSGGVWGRERGYCLMIGGDPGPVERLRPVFEALAPGVAAAARTPGRSGEPSPAEQGWLHCGPVGAGHFVKMVHNGIEYAIMAAYAEGFNILVHANAGGHHREADAETAPLADPQAFRFDLPVAELAELWRRGSVIGSWLLDLTASALRGDPNLQECSTAVADSGEGRWSAIAAIETGTPAPLLTAALFERFASRGEGDFAHRLLSAMRLGFGGHRGGGR